MSDCWNTAKAMRFTPRSSKDAYCRRQAVNDYRTIDLTHLTLLLAIFLAFYVCHRTCRLHWHVEFTELHGFRHTKEFTVIYCWLRATKFCCVSSNSIYCERVVWQQNYDFPELWLPRFMTSPNYDFLELCVSQIMTFPNYDFPQLWLSRVLTSPSFDFPELWTS